MTPAQEVEVAKAMQAAVVAAAEGAPAAAGTEGWMNVLLCEGGESSKLGLENPTVTDDGVVLKTESGDRVHVDNSGKRRVILQHLKSEKVWNDHYASLLEACRQYGKPNSILQLQAWHRTVALYVRGARLGGSGGIHPLLHEGAQVQAPGDPLQLLQAQG